MGTLSAFIKAANSGQDNGQNNGQNGLKHPVHKVLEMIDQTPGDMLAFKSEQNEDGSMTITFKIPSRAEQAKQRAMEQSLRQQQDQTGPQVRSTVDELAGVPSASNQGIAASKNVEVRVAMTPTGKALKAKYPNAFLKAMGLA
jgi:hypothetical protein